MIAIVDYGLGNLFSLQCSLSAIGAEAVVTKEPSVIRNAGKLILPGVGAYRDAVEKLSETGLGDLVKEEVSKGKPLLGICLGMQLLFDRSFENGERAGLGILEGEVRPVRELVPPDLKVPHMGWNPLRFVKESPLFSRIHDGDAMYFVHSYAAVNAPDVTAVAEYGALLTAAVGKENVYGCQFHPEKSGKAGLAVLQAFQEDIR